jgi:cell division protein FtsB
MFALLSPRLWIALALAAVLAFSHFTAYRAGKNAVRVAWDAERIEQRDAALAQSQANARETVRRLERQQENQIEQDRLLALARADAARAAAVADRLREQNAAAARQWRDALRDSPSAGVSEAAAAAIELQADVQRWVVEAGRDLAAFADAARAAGLKCENDYTVIQSVQP